MMFAVLLDSGLDPAALASASGPTLMAFIIIGFLRGWIVTQREAEDLRAQLERALDVVYTLVDITGRKVEDVEHIASKKVKS